MCNIMLVSDVLHSNLTFAYIMITLICLIAIISGQIFKLNFICITTSA